jgi:N-acetylmuramoyl-L-alanine amidase
MGLIDFLNPGGIVKVAMPLIQKAIVNLTPTPAIEPHKRRRILYLVVHCTAGPPMQSTPEILHFWARKYPNWKGRPGYHIIIDANGHCDRLQEDWNYTNGVAGYNSNCLHVCYKGGQNGIDTRTEQQKTELLRVLTRWKNIYPYAKIKGHRDFSPDKDGNGRIDTYEYIKDCPCFNAIPEYAHL